MITDKLFNDLKTKDNIKISNVNNSIKEKFISDYNDYKDNLFFEVIKSCGGIIIDNWIRLFGCGELNIITKNQLVPHDLDIIIGEDIIGGLFGVKNNIIYYFAPDSLDWECLDISYSYFINWLINDNENVNLFYKNYRWDYWEEDCKKLKCTEGVSMYPLLCTKCNINERTRKIILIDELICLNMNLKDTLK